MLKVKPLILGAGAAVLLLAAAPTAAGAAYNVPYGAEALAAFTVGEALTPTSVAGANNGCKPSAEHPYPVVLVHGTIEDEGSNWVTLSPLLANAGYCVYAFNYGETLLSAGGRVDGLGEIPHSAEELGAFIERVLAQTGASKVDIVGHSQGGMMPNYYIHLLGGASKVNELVGLAPSNHGTTVDGIAALLHAVPGVPPLTLSLLELLGAPSLSEQMIGSAFMHKLFGAGEPLSSEVRYVVIETTHDEVVTPYTNAFLHGPNVTNITIQEQCPSDPTAHIGIVWDSPALQNVLNQLGASPNPRFQAACTNLGAGI